MNKVIFILVDGLRYDCATAHMGFLEQNVEKGLISKYKIQSELPSLSRPLYEVLMTGTPVCQNGIYSNNTIRRSREKSIFNYCRENKRSTAAAAYYFISELYQKAPYEKERDRYQMNGDGLIEHGIFYYEDNYPDSHLFGDADFLIDTYTPDFLLLHPMNVDYAGHQYGGESFEYKHMVANVDDFIARYWDRWRAAGYSILITSDHGMGKDQLHGGTREEERMVPLYVADSSFPSGDCTQKIISQLAVMPLAMKLLGLKEQLPEIIRNHDQIM